MDSLVEKAKQHESKLQQENNRLKQEARQLHKLIDDQAARLAHKAGQLFKSPKSRPNAKQSHFHRVLIPDTHGAHIDKMAAAAFLADLERLSPREVVWLGDHLDCGGFLSQHHTLGFVAELAYSYCDDIAAANEFIDEVQKRTPKAVHHFLTGNHEHRVQRWCVEQAINNPRDAEMHYRNYSVEHVLHLEKRGINYYKRDYCAKDSREQGSIRLGNCNFVHDVSTSRTPARDAVNRWAANVMFGDTHRIDVHYGRKGGRDIVGATNGHLSNNVRKWQETNIVDWMHGYGVHAVTSNDEFLHISVPIIGDHSLLGPLLGVVK